jgi:hydrogenase maturation protease
VAEPGRLEPRPLVVGLGNEMRGDDAAGLEVADRLAAAGHEAVRCEREPIELIELWAGRRQAIVVDAVAGAEPGRIWRFDGNEELPAALGAGPSTHLLGLAEAIALAISLGRTPPRLRVIGIEGDSFALGTGPSPAVRGAVEEVVASLSGELATRGGVSERQATEGARTA